MLSRTWAFQLPKESKLLVVKVRIASGPAAVKVSVRAGSIGQYWNDGKRRSTLLMKSWAVAARGSARTKIVAAAPARSRVQTRRRGRARSIFMGRSPGRPSRRGVRSPANERKLPESTLNSGVGQGGPVV